MPIIQKTVINPETKEEQIINIPQCRFCKLEYQPYECDVFKNMRIIREEHINVCQSCHKKLIPEISNIRSTADFYHLNPSNGKWEIKPEYRTKPKTYKECFPDKK